MVNKQKGVQQDTAYSAVVVNDHMYPRPCLYVSMTPFGSKNGIHMNCTIGSILLHSVLHPPLHFMK